MECQDTYTYIDPNGRPQPRPPTGQPRPPSGQPRPPQPPTGQPNPPTNGEQPKPPTIIDIFNGLGLGRRRAFDGRVPPDVDCDTIAGYQVDPSFTRYYGNPCTDQTYPNGFIPRTDCCTCSGGFRGTLWSFCIVSLSLIIALLSTSSILNKVFGCCH